MTQQQTETQETTTVINTPSQRTVQQTTAINPVVDAGSAQKTYETKKVIFRSYQVIWYILGLIEVLLAFRVLLKLLGASTQSGFTSFIYAMSAPLALPFAGILGTMRISSTIFEWSTLIAMMVYAVLAYGLVALFQLVKPTNPTEVDLTIDNQ